MKSKTVIITAALLMSIYSQSIDAIAQDSSKQELRHADTCPQKCDACKEILKNALEYLKTESVKENYPWENVVAPFNGLAFLSTGSSTKDGQYKEALKQIKKRVIHFMNREIIAINGSAWLTSFYVWFLSELYAKDPTENLKKEIIKGVRTLEHGQLSLGGWGHYVWQQKDNLKLKTQIDLDLGYPMDLVANTNCVYIALLRAKYAGIETDESVLKKLLEYYERAENPGTGGFVYACQYYNGKNKNNFIYFRGAGPDSARTGASILALNFAGLGCEKVCKSAIEFFNKGLSHCNDGHGSPILPLFYNGYASHIIGGQTWKDYMKHFHTWVCPDKNGSVKFTKKESNECYGYNALTAVTIMTINIPEYKIMRNTEKACEKKVEGTIECALKNLNDPKPEVRRRAIRELIARDAAEHADKVSELLPDRDAGVRADVCEALGNFEAKIFLNKIEPLLKDKDSKVKQSAAEAIGTLGGKEHAKQIAMLLDDSQVSVRKSALKALGTFKAKDFSDKIAQRLESDDDTEIVAAADALGYAGCKNKSADLIKLLTADNPWIKEAALRALANIGAKENANEVAKLLKDNERWVRAAAVWALQRLDSKDHISEIATVLTDQDPWVKCYAIDAVVHFGAKEHSAAIAKLLTDWAGIVKGHAVNALGKLSSKEHAKEIAALMEDKGWYITIVNPAAKRWDVIYLKDMAANTLKDLGLNPDDFKAKEEKK